ncbi:hypothetical protein ON010_g5892 [Phytophthora cinnamomi]|nr:hypothetical protein ON010_g5892 [Phytophthora cinnamomi]
MPGVRTSVDFKEAEEYALVMILAAVRGYLDMLKWLAANGSRVFTSSATDAAASGGHLNVLSWLNKNDDSKRAESKAAPLMRWMMRREQDTPRWSNGFTLTAAKEPPQRRWTDGAASAGHLEVEKWLSTNRTEGCITNSIDLAACFGHFEVFLDIRLDGCTAEVMDAAALMETSR